MPNVSFTVDAGRDVTAYASYTRGLEDSINAPASAVNRGESVPATPTRQVDGGLRIAPRQDLRLLLGVFKVQKTYFNLDTTGRYGELGDISSKGVEASATLSARNSIKLVAGVVLIRSEVNRHHPVTGVDGAVPVGRYPARSMSTLTTRRLIGGRGPPTLQWTSLSARVVSNNDQIELPPMSSLNVGVRYKLQLFHRAFSARFDVANLLNERGLTISSLYAVYPILRRTYTLTFTADL